MKNGKPRSAVISVKAAAKRFADIIGRFYDDGVTIYAAQATFYTILASIPFMMLLISLAKYIVPEAVDALFRAMRQLIPERFGDIFTTLYEELTSRADLSLMSMTILTALWSSSRSIASVIRGVAFIYDADNRSGVMRSTFYSIIYTVAFVLLIISALVVLVFGVTIRNILSYRFPRLENLLSLILGLRGVVFFVILTLFFSLIYYAVAKNIIRSSGKLRKYGSQIPGAVFASAGWMLFSYFFSLYIKYYPSASYIYGSLAAVMLLMLWMYFCMVILLAGAEINKLLRK